MPATSGYRPGLTANWITGQVSRKVLVWVSKKGGGRKQWSNSCWADVTFIYTLKKWRARHWHGTGPVNQVGVAPPWWSSNLEREGDSQHVSTHCVLSASSTGCCCLYCPLTGSLSPLPFPVPPLPPPCPQCTWCNRKGRRTTPGVRRPWLRAGPPSAAAASWTTWTEQPRPKRSLQACCLL